MIVDKILWAVPEPGHPPLVWRGIALHGGLGFLAADGQAVLPLMPVSGPGGAIGTFLGAYTRGTGRDSLAMLVADWQVPGEVVKPLMLVEPADAVRDLRPAEVH